MGNTAVLLITASAIVGVVLLILKVKVHPALALVLGSVYLGLATGLGPKQTVATVTRGFGDLMAEVGLLIVFGVLLGTLLSALGAIEKLVSTLLSLLGPRRLPYSFAVTVGTLLQSIFADVLLVMTAPLARSLGKRIGPYGTPRMATAMALGVEVGIALAVPGIGALALAGLLDIPLGTMLLYGFPVTAVTIVAALFLFGVVARRGFWNPETDETPAVTDPAPEAPEQDGNKLAGTPPLALSLSPLLLALSLIAFGAFAEICGWKHPVIDFLGDPVIGLLTGLVGACLIVRRQLPAGAVGDAFQQAFRTSGQILVLTGVGGSLAAMVEKAGIGEIVKGSFSASTWAPLALVWLIAALLHMAIGSVTTSAITAAGILAPVAPQLDVEPVLIALAAGAGSLFAIHATSNTFWLLQTLMGQTTRGTLKTCTITVSGASVIALLLIQLLSFVS